MKATTFLTSIMGAVAAASPLLSRNTATCYQTTYQIKDLTLRKYDGKTISTMFFNIAATNGGTLDFECAPYDPVTQGTTENFEAGKVYFCGENSLFSFSYVPAHDEQTNELFLWQDVSDTVTLGGSGFVDDPICHAGGSSVNDLVCSVPPQVYFAITMDKLGQ